MENLPINPQASSNIKWARYDPFHELLEIDFKDNDGNYQSTYEYGARGEGRKVTRQDWEDFRAAPRPGVFFDKRIRGKFPYRKISKPKDEKAPEPEQPGLF